MVDTRSSLSCNFCSSDSPSILGILMSVTTRSADLMPELLQDESLDIRLVVNDQDGGHAARSTSVSISLRRITKSIGLVRNPSAPPSRALRFVSASP